MHTRWKTWCSFLFATVQEIVMRNALVFWSYDTASYLCYSIVERLSITQTLFQLESERSWKSDGSWRHYSLPFSSFSVTRSGLLYYLLSSARSSFSHELLSETLVLKFNPGKSQHGRKDWLAQCSTPTWGASDYWQLVGEEENQL